MDTKALARSKRAHTQHHSKKAHHPNQASKASSEATAGSASAKKPLGKQPRERIHRPVGLPSNLDRYDDEFDSDSEQHLAGDKAMQTSDDVLPKSKGADYRHLVTEALSQSQSNIDSFPSFDDVLPDFNQGVSSMLAVRGEGILSWIGDDNFIVDDRATPSHEASFLSLNLHALAEQLEEIELSKRLFIEAELLPPELNFPEKAKITNQSNKVRSSDSRRGLPDMALSNKGLHSVNHVDIDLKQHGKSGQMEALESTEKSKAISTIDGKASVSSFKAAAAEAELDMLLDSFNEAEAPDSGFDFSGQVSDKSKTSSVTANIDDVLDDLLKETSNLKVNLPNNVQSITSGGTGTKSKVLDDFDSWLDTI